MINPFSIYLIMTADSVNGVFCALAVIFSIVSAFICLYVISNKFEKNKNTEEILFFEKLLKPLFVYSVLLIALTVLTPSTQTLASMYVIPALANSKQATELSGASLDLIKLARTALQEQIKKAETHEEETK